MRATVYHGGATMKVTRTLVVVGVGLAMSATGLSGVAVAQPLPPGSGPGGRGPGLPGPTPSAASLCASVPSTTTSEQATSPCSPVNLATPVNFADGFASHGATVLAGDARFEVLTSGLVRLEYSPTGNFENAPTVNVVDRRFPVPPYSASEANGVLTITTSAMTLKYQLGSGPFTPANTSFTYYSNGKLQTASPNWTWECPFGQVCDAGAATLANGAGLAANHLNYQSIAGFIDNLGQADNASATWTVLNAPAGQATLTVRYSNYVGALGGPAPRTIDVTVNGSDTQTLTLPPTTSWDTWATVSTNVALTSGTDTVGLLCGAADSCNVNVDTISLAGTSSPAPTLPSMGYLGGWTRSFDRATYGTGYTCPPSTPTATQCQAATPVMHPGLLDTAGWDLLDDTQSAQYTPQGWVEPRPANGDVEDGYLFVYGDNFKSALETFAKLTGPAPLLPESIFGVWYSDYYPYTTADYEDTLIPAFRANDVPLDTLSVDTDWKSPNTWDGWEWNPALFPDPQAFLQWAKSQGINVTLNIHSSISPGDPELPEAEAIAGNDLATQTGCDSGTNCYVWDWSNVAQAESNFALQQPLQADGVAFWWLDWCCDASTVSMPGLTPDDWVDHLYAQQMVNENQRGFVLARIGSSYQEPDIVYPAGPWSAHTSAIHFTGDTWGTWDTLAFEAQLSADEATIGEPYISDDIGSFLGPPPGGPSDTPDLYARWIQLGTFQPVLRMHSNHGDRLPWEYPQPADTIAANFLRLREALVPYTYTLAAEANKTGLPITSPLYLYYPDQAAAYTNPGEYLYGPDVLVAPVTSPGNVVNQQVWFPPGRWVDWFTGATFEGPSEQTVQVPLDRMPVFVRAGGVIPEQPAMEHVGAEPLDPLTLRVFPGADGQFTLYQDAGTGLGYEHGEYSLTTIQTTTGPVPPGGPGNAGPGNAGPGNAGPGNGGPGNGGPGNGGPGQGPAGPGCSARAAFGNAGQGNAGEGNAGPGNGGPGNAGSGNGGPGNGGPGQHPGGPYSQAEATVVIGAACGGYPGEAMSRAYQLQLVDLSQPSQVLLDGGPLAQVAPGGSDGWWYDAASQTVEVAVPETPVSQRVVVTELGGATVSRSEPAVAELSLSPSTPLSLSPGQTTTLTSTVTDMGPGSISNVDVTLAAPAGWQVSPSSASVASVAQDASASQSWTVTAPSAGSGPQSAAVEATATYVSDITGTTQSVTAQEEAPSPLPPVPPPTITSVSPSSGGVGTVITVNGDNFGATQGSSYVLFFVPGISWGAPYDGATLDILSWSNTQVTFALPAPSGAGGEYHIAAGETGEAVVGVGGVTSNAEPISITSSVTTPPNAPVVTGVSPSSAAAGTAVTISGSNFGASQVSTLSDFVTLTDSSGATWGAPEGAKGPLTITSWSPTSVTFLVPSGAATGSATVNVTTNNFTSNSEQVKIT